MKSSAQALTRLKGFDLT